MMQHLELLKHAIDEQCLRELLRGTIKSLDKQKVFCIGRNKTGTTSMGQAFSDLGMIVGHQRMAEYLLHDWAKKDFRRLITLCHTAQAFQDAPFSYPYTYQALDEHFPGSKFILTIRDTPDQWYESLIRFHSRIFGHGSLPTSEDLKNARYLYKGYIFTAHQLLYHTPEDDLYNKEILISHYENHNKAVIDYFKDRKDDLLVINIAKPGAYEQLCTFLGIKYTGEEFPHMNRTADFENQHWSPSHSIKLSQTLRTSFQRLLPPGSNFKKIFIQLKKILNKQKIEEQLTTIRNSGFFDSNWYLQKYPEIQSSGMDPDYHYLMEGGFTGLDPGPDFDSSYYLATYLDVQNEGINPLLHYLQYGRSEGRSPLPKQTDPSS